MVDLPDFFNKTDFFGKLLPGYITVILILTIFRPDVFVDENTSADILLAVVFLIAGPSVGFTLLMFSRSLDYLKQYIFNQNQSNNILQYFKLRTVINDSDRFELDETLSEYDFCLSTGISLMGITLYYSITNFYNSNNDIFLISLLLVFAIVLLIGSILQKRKAFDPLYTTLLGKHNLTSWQFTGNQSYREYKITLLYLLILNRYPEKHEIKRIIDVLLPNNNLETIIDELIYSEEYSGNVVDELYKRFLDRKCFPDEKIKWTYALMNKTSIQELILDLCDSSEYKNKHPVLRAFIESLYIKILENSSPSSQEIDKYLNLYDPKTNSCREIIKNFLLSEDYAKKEILKLYRAIVGGEPSFEGMNNGAVWLRQGISYQEIIKRLLR
jgi:hypothetical protein